jgi:HTH-type transcriptional regulator / antitoxin HigA
MKMWTLIESEKEHREALKHIDKLFDEMPEAGSVRDKELKLLIHLVEKYEEEKFPIGNPDAIDAIKIRMQDLKLSQSDLISCIGDKGTISKVLNRQRPLSIEMIRKLEQKLQLPASVLIQKPKARKLAKHSKKSRLHA